MLSATLVPLIVVFLGAGALGDDAPIQLSPGAVQNLQAAVTSPGQIHAEWQTPLVPNGPVDGFEVTSKIILSNSTLRNPKNQQQSVQAFKSDRLSPEMSINFDGLTEETLYQIEVCAYNVDMNNSTVRHKGPTSSIRTLLPPMGKEHNDLTLTVSVSPKPRSLTIEKVSGVVSDRITHVQIGIVNETSIQFHIFGLPNSSLELSDLRAFTDYTLTVQACIGAESDLCGLPDQFQLRTLIGAPSAPTNLTFHYSPSNLTVYWNPPLEINGPKISYYEVSVSFDASRSVKKLCYEGPLMVVFESNELVHDVAHYKIHVVAVSSDENKQLLQSEAAEATVDLKKGHELHYTWIACGIFFAAAVVVLNVFFFTMKLKRDRRHTVGDGSFGEL